MQIKIRIPNRLIRAWMAFVKWGNVTMYERGRIDIRRIDFLLTTAFIICTAWYGFMMGWIGALQGAGAFIFLVILGLLMRPN